jgi:ABC-type branched-subunit amino acid transport system substrate-binding protein
MFRLPPDDGKQAAVIVSDGIEANSLSSVGLITSTDHDGRVFAEEMSEQMASAQSPPVFHLEVSLENPDLEMTAARAGSFGSDGIIVRLPVEKVLAFLEAVESEGYRSPILIPWIPGLLPADLGERYTGDIHYVVPFSETDNGAYDVFVNEYSERFGRSPLPSAAYTFDALNILMRSIEQTGQVDLSRAGLRDAIAGASGYVGVTGPVSWDNAGGNEAEPTLRLLAGRGMTN